MFERFTSRARRVLVLAQEEARLLNHGFIGTEHLLLGLVREGNGVAAKALESLDISLEAVRQQVAKTIEPGAATPSSTGSPPFTPRAKKVLELSLREALQLGHNYIGTEHLLLGLVREGNGVAAQVLQKFGIDLERVRQTVISLLASGGPDKASQTRDQPSREVWREYPTRILQGPHVHLGSDGLEFSVTGVLIYDESIQVFWQLSGVPTPIAELMIDSAFSAAVQQGDSMAYVSLTDDLDTEYSLDNARVAARPDNAFVGHSRFAPVPPSSVTQLNVKWQGESIALEL